MLKGVSSAKRPQFCRRNEDCHVSEDGYLVEKSRVHRVREDPLQDMTLTSFCTRITPLQFAMLRAILVESHACHSQGNHAINVEHRLLRVLSFYVW